MVRSAAPGGLRGVILTRSFPGFSVQLLSPGPGSFSPPGVQMAAAQRSASHLEKSESRWVRQHFQRKGCRGNTSPSRHAPGPPAPRPHRGGSNLARRGRARARAAGGLCGRQVAWAGADSPALHREAEKRSIKTPPLPWETNDAPWRGLLSPRGRPHDSAGGRAPRPQDRCAACAAGSPRPDDKSHCLSASQQVPSG